MNSPAPVTVDSDLLGPLTLAPEQLVRFPTGLFGFPDARRFALLPAERDGMYWLQAAEQSALIFLLIDPFRFVEGYAVDVAAPDLADLQADAASEIAILAIVTLPRRRIESPTANLQGPLALNLKGGLAKQIAVADESWDVRHPIDLP